mmetsp:Transcript_9987/g.11615  ORF Transcript_9987/g.11615 Transcript_9987/m.11615 type:complete len:803 (+) Transcript_9987:90-2498(+)|eukprot:CAMPEP_0197850758 /NCGR_PEP_ID=MMETSP1438-20131217/16272_1 /TAXON_ID=1461541 /ORGANISM="Pterosperma sp., Strain CCMP1384" /LENGTH=802 /DNA_ID=CAMNT_0043464091 /DNA_START=80 /DNA_END=2488 /DNA_ORIENTATION=-
MSRIAQLSESPLAASSLRGNDSRAPRKTDGRSSRISCSHSAQRPNSYGRRVQLNFKPTHSTPFIQHLSTSENSERVTFGRPGCGAGRGAWRRRKVAKITLYSGSDNVDQKSSGDGDKKSDDSANTIPESLIDDELDKTAFQENWDKTGQAGKMDTGSYLSPKLLYQPPVLPKPLYVLVLEPEAQDGLELVRKCVSQGLANAVMLRDGDVSTQAYTEKALELQMLCRSLDLIFIIESRIGCAAAILADGVQLQRVPSEQEIPIRAVRDFLEKIRDGNGHGRLVLGRAVKTAEEAKRANFGSADFVLVEPDDNEGNGEEDEMEEVIDEEDGSRSWRAKGSDPLEQLLNIRKATSCHVLVTQEFTAKKLVTANSVLSAGADGFEIPASAIRDLFAAQAQRGMAKPATELPDGGRLWGAVALIAGGTVGAGIIALPVKTAAAGFIPSTICLTLCWCYMSITAMLLIELSLWYGPGTNLTTMTQNTLGKTAKYVATAIYLFIYAATLTAYIAEGGNLLNTGLAAVNMSCPGWLISAVFTGFCGGFVYLGTGPTEKLNSACLAVAIVAYVGLVCIGAQSIQPHLLLRQSWSSALPSLPIMVVAFTFHNIVPSLLAYLGTAKRVVQAVVYGSLLPLVLYVIWQFVILGTIANSANLTSANDIILGLKAAAGPIATNCVQVFSFFAIVTSFLGVALGCVDFLSDLVYNSTKAKAENSVSKQRFVSLCIACIPAFVVAISCPGIFYSALEFSGTFRLILFGILPALMVWKGRNAGKPAWLPGGKLVLFLVMTVASVVIGIEWSKRLGMAFL